MITFRIHDEHFVEIWDERIKNMINCFEKQFTQFIKYAKEREMKEKKENERKKEMGNKKREEHLF